jgi:hypothetical protein
MKTRSLFWPLTFITIGVLWLLGMTRVIPWENLWALAHLAPFALIAIGVSLLVRAVWPAGGVIVSFLVVAGIILAVVFAPQLKWNDMPSWAMNWDIGETTGGGIAGSGDISSVTQDVPGVNSVEVDYPSDVTIQKGEAETVSIEADDNLLPQLNTKVVNGNLVIRNTESRWNDRVRPTERIQVTITVKDLRRVQFSDAGTLNISGLDVDDLDIEISGICDVTVEDLKASRLNYQISGIGSSEVAGVVQSLKLEMSGLGDFKGENLSVQDADVQLSGAGTATLWVTEDLKAEISGAGSLNYYGNPSVSKQITGAGTVNAKGDK